MTVTSVPAPTPTTVVTWPTEHERAEFLTVGMDDYTLARLRTAPIAEATFHARYALRWGTNPNRVAQALADAYRRAL